MDDRRRHQRFKLADVCIIRHEKTVGTLIDISPGGLSCMCLDLGQCCQEQSTPVDIYCKKYGLCAENIMIRVLATGMVPGEFLKILGLRKCHAEFPQLDESQLARVKKIIVTSSLSR